LAFVFPIIQDQLQEAKPNVSNSRFAGFSVFGVHPLGCPSPNTAERKMRIAEQRLETFGAAPPSREVRVGWRNGMMEGWNEGRLE
jgi:hypothetical protein